MTTGGRRWNGRSRRHRQGPFFSRSSFLQPPPTLPLLLPFFFFFVSPNSVCVPLCILAYARNGNAGGESPVVDCCQAQALAVGMWAKTVEASGAAAATTSAVQSGSAVPIQLKKPRQPRHYGRRPARRASWPSGGEEDAARGSA
jgi:hypothetical protein